MLLVAEEKIGRNETEHGKATEKNREREREKMARVRLSLRVSLSRETTVGDRHRERERGSNGRSEVGGGRRGKDGGDDVGSWG